MIDPIDHSYAKVLDPAEVGAASVAVHTPAVALSGTVTTTR